MLPCYRLPLVDVRGVMLDIVVVSDNHLPGLTVLLISLDGGLRLYLGLLPAD